LCFATPTRPSIGAPLEPDRSPFNAEFKDKLRRAPIGHHYGSLPNAINCVLGLRLRNGGRDRQE